jgi:hypothetical protein
VRQAAAIRNHGRVERLIYSKRKCGRVGDLSLGVPSNTTNNYVLK